MSRFINVQGIGCGRMKEMWKQTLTRSDQTSYSKYGDIFMAEPGQGETPPKTPMGIDEATRRLEEAARQGEARRRTEQGRQTSATGGGGRGGEGRPPAPPTPEEPERGKEEPEQPSDRESSEDTSSSSGRENDSSSQEGVMSKEEYVNQANQLLEEIKTSEFKPILARAISTSPDEIPRLYRELSDAYNKIHDDLYNRKTNLQPKDRNVPMSAEALAQQAEIEAQLNNLAQERDRIIALLSPQMQSQTREGSSQNSALGKIIEINNNKRIDIKEKEKQVIEALRDISTSEGLRTELIDSIIEYDNALEYLVNRIISEPLDAETSGYQLSFYGGINFALVRDRMRVWSERQRRDAFGKEKGDKEAENSIEKAESKEGLSLKFEYMKSGAELFHNMNWKIVTGDIEQFVGVARGITVEHLQVLQRVRMAAMVMRLYEQELQNVISRDGKITPENYADVIGTILDKKGTPTGKQPGRVEMLLSRYNESLPLGERLESWQLKWAFYTGRNMMNITLRAAELIAQSKEIGYRSYVQEAASRIIDPLNLTAERFGIAEPRGGVHFLSMVKEIFDKNKKQFGWKENGIKTMMGGDRVEFESRGIFNITGVWSSWRENNIVQIWETDPNKLWETDPNDSSKKRRRTLSIEDLTGNTGRIKTLAEKLKSELKDKLGRKLKKEEEEAEEVKALRDTFLTPKGELKEEFCHSLGIMLKIGDLLPDEKKPGDKDYDKILDTKREVRAAIWRRVARDNPLAMINFLRGMRFEKGKEPQVKEGEPSINTRLEALDKLMFTEETKFTDGKRWPGAKEREKKVLKGTYRDEETEEWKEFREKLTVAHEKRMKRLAQGELVSLDDVIKDMDFDKYDNDALKDLRNLGQIVAPRLADVRFSSNPFMNDVLLEDAQYTKAGAEFFRRRLGSDIPSIYQAGGKFPQLMDNPGGLPVEKALETLTEMERALESPNGTVSGQDDVSSVFEAYLEFTEAGGNAENVPGFIKFLVQESVLGINIGKMLKKRNSWAQVYSGPGALAEDIFQTSKTLDEALKMGILRRGTGRTGELWTDLYERFRKKFKAKPMWFILRFIFDAFPIFAAGMFFDIGQKSVKEKG